MPQRSSNGEDKAIFSFIIQKHEQIKFTEKKLQEYEAMWFELVDEVSDVQKTAKKQRMPQKRLKIRLSNIWTW